MALLAWKDEQCGRNWRRSSCFRLGLAQSPSHSTSWRYVTVHLFCQLHPWVVWRQGNFTGHRVSSFGAFPLSFLLEIQRWKIRLSWKLVKGSIMLAMYDGFARSHQPGIKRDIGMYYWSNDFLLLQNWAADWQGGRKVEERRKKKREKRKRFKNLSAAKW